MLCHSDCEGFYIPIPFTDLIIDTKDEDRIEGGLLGSSHQLFDELNSLAPALGIQVQSGQLADSAIDEIRTGVDNEEELWIERAVWLTLFEASRLSILHKTAICFT